MVFKFEWLKFYEFLQIVAKSIQQWRDAKECDTQLQWHRLNGKGWHVTKNLEGYTKREASTRKGILATFMS